jgi:hypothetical protein
MDFGDHHKEGDTNQPPGMGRKSVKQATLSIAFVDWGP